MYSLLRPLLFRLDPETAHSFSLRALQGVGSIPGLASLVAKLYGASGEPVEAFGLRFANRLGVAAGYDKDGRAWRGLAALGFGHVEIGTVTPRPQPGNPRPRLFRLAQDEALINRLGFPSQGSEAVVRRLQGKRPPGLIVGVNLGINKDTALEQAAQDYLALMNIVTPLADYLTINVSSPNTAGLRQLQGQRALDDLLGRLAPQRRKPLLVKLSPDLDERQLDEALDVLISQRVDGVIATNTTLARPALASRHAAETGGLSGRPLTATARKMVGRIYTRTRGKLPIVASGGIMSRQDAEAAINAGATLVQIYTGLVYRGPRLVKEILEGE